ncbi:ABC transporter substrate-binding protein [Variovorax sp. NFACC27]|nr:ABC transporter substrate-binding protein [Variovorax sp. YR750]SEF19936.1 amino acid/amide ABC transporter substrate-binding protein, HAAT family (TC 3.A.1.4.-) [Variovorax sp. NFACC28]SEF65360.1 amino acid/amide ABC transporter substrate-binding protein, HAAT family (TC 3.A.1.4.-) [Variovorax sp. NFACC29]SFB74349.1 amino acid/amide ABC transporter substrate-binding protein, HAAT family (TC 3.A.1.4.-) [Variovorax sp. NFACC26]SFG55037.1 amino acid/amide ABC transporter substrate-binding prot
MLAGSLAVPSLALARVRPLRIGVIGSWSGPYAGGGRQFDAGMAVWLAAHNQHIAGRPVELLRRDVPGSAPEQARRHAQDLVESERVELLAGLDFSSNAYAVGNVATQAKLPLVVMNAASSGITARCPFAVRVSFTIGQVALPLARWALQQGLRNVCTVVADYASGVDAESAFVSGITAGGGQVGAMLRVPLSTLDYSAYMLRLRELKPQAVFFFLPSGQMPATFLKFWRDRGMADTGIRLLATGDATDDHYLEGIGELADGLVTSHHYSFAHDSAANRRFTGIFENEYGSHLRPGYFAVAAHDALAAVDAAMSSPAARGNATGERLVDAFRGLKLDSPRGPVEIDAHTRDIVQTVYIRRVERREGRWVNREFERFERVRDPGV